MQDPVTGSCYNDIIMVDSRSWQWMALEVHCKLVMMKWCMFLLFLGIP